MRASWTTLTLLALVILAVAAIGQLGNRPTERFAIETMISVVFVVGLSIFSGNSGVLSFGHAGFAAIGAYAAAWITIPLIQRKLFLPDLPEVLMSIEAGLPGGLALAVALAGLAAMVIGIAVVRLNGIAASIATLAWLVIVYSVFTNTQQLTKGTASLVGLPVLVTLPVATGLAFIAVLVAFAFQRSRIGLMLQASREDEAAAAASGINVRAVRYLAFVLSAMVVAAAGTMQGHFLGVLSVGQFWLELTFMSMAMLVIGGLRSLSGAVIGAVVLSGVAEPLRLLSGGFNLAGLTVPSLPGLREVALALIMLVSLLLRPNGLTKGFEIGLKLRKPKSR
jgi:branched-chain amino acid transport system permease protein